MHNYRTIFKTKGSQNHPPTKVITSRNHMGTYEMTPNLSDVTSYRTGH